MSSATTELNLQVAVGADDTADYLTNKLGGSLQVIDGLFSQPSGHTHSGPHQGGLIRGSAFSGPMDIPDWFRSTGQTTGFPNTGQGIELYWGGSQGVLQAYDRGANQYRPLYVASSDIQFVIGGAEVLEIDAAGNWNLWGGGHKVGSIRPHGTDGFEFVNAAYTTVTLTIDGSGNLSVPGNVTAQGTVSTNALQVNGATTLAALTVNGTATHNGQTNINGLSCTAINTNGQPITSGAISASGAITSPSHQTSGNVTVQNNPANIVPYTVQGAVEHIEHGQMTMNGVTNNTGQNQAITFARPFNSNPIVIISVGAVNSGDVQQWHAAAQNISTIGFNARMFNTSGATGNGQVYWLAMGN